MLRGWVRCGKRSNLLFPHINCTLKCQVNNCRSGSTLNSMANWAALMMFGQTHSTGQRRAETSWFTTSFHEFHRRQIKIRHEYSCCLELKWQNFVSQLEPWNSSFAALIKSQFMCLFEYQSHFCLAHLASCRLLSNEDTWFNLYHFQYLIEDIFYQCSRRGRTRESIEY